MFLRRRSGNPAPSSPRYAFCERVTASAISPVHVRVVGPEGLKTTGGAPDTTLCGVSLDNGWDLNGPVTMQAVTAEYGLQQPGRVCVKCAQAYVTAEGR